MEKVQPVAHIKPVRRRIWPRIVVKCLVIACCLGIFFGQLYANIDSFTQDPSHVHSGSKPPKDIDGNAWHADSREHHRHWHAKGGHHGGHGGDHEKKTSLKKLRKHVKQLVSKNHLKQNLEDYFLAGPHLSGQNLELVNHTVDAFRSSGLEANIEEYDIWVNYPVSHRAALLNEDGTVKTELSLEEPVLPEDPTTGWEDRIPTFHGFSASGNATGELIYANLGRREDYDRLVDEGISLQGKVVLVRYGGLFRGLKVKFAEELGASAVLIYSDPAEDGGITEAEGFEAYPNGPARNPDSVQRGSVQDLSHAPGDPTTPGWASKPGNSTERTKPQGIPGIPSIPISYNDALPLLKALNGHGPRFSDWKGALKGIKYNVGPSSLKVTLESEQDYDFRRNYDVIARIPGETSAEVIIGNHRDAWIIGGADPNSGTAVMLEVARVFGELVERGWKPHRTIVFASWDGEEYGLLGSTEWGEDHANDLTKNAVAYINCDVGVSGTHFSVSANPLLRKVIEDTVEIVDINNQTLSEHWGGNRDLRISPLGSGSDYTVFQDHLGIPSLDVGFGPGDGDAVYHYHSNYDSLHWMQEYGDPDLSYHEAVTKFVALSALEIVEKKAIAFDVVSYADSIKRDIKHLLGSYEGAADEHVGSLFQAMHRFAHEARRFTHDLHKTTRQFKEIEKGHGVWNWFKYVKLRLQIAKFNSKLQGLDKKFLYEKGLDTRPWFKHIVYAPGRYTGYAGQVFPGIAESLEDDDQRNLMRWVQIAADAVNAAADSLQ